MRNVLAIGCPLLISLLVLGGSAFARLEDPALSLHVVWHGVGLSIFAAGQQFIAGFMGGHRLGAAGAMIFLAMCAASLAASLLGIVTGGEVWIRAFALVNLAMLSHYSLSTGMLRPRRITNRPIAMAFLIASAWAFVGCATILVEPAYADFALHSMAVGWAMTLVIVTSMNIFGFLSGRPVSPWLTGVVLAAWQVVPLGRGLGFLPSLRGGMAIVTATMAGLVLVTWAGLLIHRALLVHRRIFSRPP